MYLGVGRGREGDGGAGGREGNPGDDDGGNPDDDGGYETGPGLNARRVGGMPPVTGIEFIVTDAGFSFPVPGSLVLMFARYPL